MIRFLEHRIGDRRIIRLIQKWLKAGVLEDEVVSVSERGRGRVRCPGDRGGCPSLRFELRLRGREFRYTIGAWPDWSALKAVREARDRWKRHLVGNAGIINS